jgi:hypothetical protein
LGLVFCQLFWRKTRKNPWKSASAHIQNRSKIFSQTPLRTSSYASFRTWLLIIVLRHDEGEYHHYQQLDAIFLQKILDASQVLVGRKWLLFLEKQIFLIVLLFSNRFLYSGIYTESAFGSWRLHMIIRKFMIMLYNYIRNNLLYQILMYPITYSLISRLDVVMYVCSWEVNNMVVGNDNVLLRAYGNG